MTNRQSAFTYGVIVACAVSLGLLVSDYPSEQNLLAAILGSLAVGVGSWFRLDRR